MANTHELEAWRDFRRTELSDYDKGRIDAYHDAKLSSTEIGKKIDRPPSTIRSYLQKRRIHGYETLPRPGRPEKISDREFRSLARYIKHNRSQKYASVRANTLPHVPLRTIQRKLKKTINMRKQSAKERPELNADHAGQ